MSSTAPLFIRCPRCKRDVPEVRMDFQLGVLVGSPRLSEHPELQSDPDNFRHSHTLCNQQRGAGAPALDLGEQMPAWWL